MECATDIWEGFGHSNYLKDFGRLGTGSIGDIYIYGDSKSNSSSPKNNIKR